MNRFSLISRRITTSVLQFSGNILKGVFYCDMRLRPGKRYIIEPFAPALLSLSAPKAIPRVIWLTNYTGRVTLSVYANYLFNRLMAPTFEFRFFDDAHCAEFIKKNYSDEVYDHYSRLQIGAAKADFWRILVLLSHGGIYMDIDAALLWPPESLLRPDQTELLIRTKDGLLTNYFMASAPSNPVFKAISKRILENIKEASIASVFDMTGPSVVAAEASAYPVYSVPYYAVCKQGLLTNKKFQYADDHRRYWVTAQMLTDIVKKRHPPA